MASNTKSRALGSIWGVCVCDALGGPVQFSQPGSFEALQGMEDVTPFSEPAGSYSDDGAMTLALAQSFIDSQGAYNHPLSIRYFLDWIHSGRFSTTSYAWDVGISTRAALDIWSNHGIHSDKTTGPGPGTGAQQLIDIRLNRESRSGNGSLMRIAPVGVMLWRDAAAAASVAADQGRVTHPSLACVEACEVYTDLMCRVMNGATKQGICAAVKARRGTLKHEVLAEWLGRYGTVAEWAAAQPEGGDDGGGITSSGWVVHTLVAALWGFFKFDSFGEGALAVVNLGGDSDTVGAVYGGIAGAFYGYEAIPGEWVDRMQNQTLISEIAWKFAALAAS